MNTETTVRVRQFPINYYPVDYPFFGVSSAVSGVGYNIAKALSTLGDQVELCSMCADDFPAAQIRHELSALGIDSAGIKPVLKESPGSVVLYDGDGRRQIYSDLKDIQERSYGFGEDICAGVDLVVACNVNYNRELLPLARRAGKTIATDVHVLTNIWDDYNRDFLSSANIVFMSDEGIGDDYGHFMWELAHSYSMDMLVLGRGSKGAAMYLRETDRITEHPAMHVGDVVNTVGAGDALFSAFIHCYAQGLSPEEALCRAQLFASAKIRHSGASKGFISQAALDELYNEYLV